MYTKTGHVLIRGNTNTLMDRTTLDYCGGGHCDEADMVLRHNPQRRECSDTADLAEATQQMRTFSYGARPTLENATIYIQYDS